MSDTRLRSVPLAQLVSIEQRYARAADVNRDRTRHEALPPFRFTDKSLSILRALIGEDGPANGIATAIIGPYGSGKSFFTLALMALLDGRQPDAWTIETLGAVKALDSRMADRIVELQSRGGYLSVAFEATPEGIARPLLAAVREQIPRVGPRSALSRRLTAMLRQNREGDLLAFVEDLAAATSESGMDGVLIAVDEFGRVLEGDPASSTRALAIIQELAELAERSSSPRIHLLVTIHQNFQDYTTPLSRGRKAEWAKVQGRFHQMPYLPNPADSYAALADSIVVSAEIEGVVGSWARDTWGTCQAALGSVGLDGLDSLVIRLWPLHPLTAFLLPRLAVAIGQNERTLFAFMSSGDPRALRAWVNRHHFASDPGSLPCIELDYLFDYFAGAEFGSGLPRRTRQVLAQARFALERLDDANGLRTRVAKVVAAVALARDYCSLRATPLLMRAALSSVSGVAVDETLSALVSDHVLLYRQYSGEYVLNPGSGIDVDELIDRAVREVAGSASLPNEVERIANLEPVIAHRLTFERGTTRAFARAFVSPDSLNDELFAWNGWQEARSRPDGRIRYVLAVDESQLASVRAVAPRVSSPTDVLVVPPEPLAGLPQVAIELAALEKMQSNPHGLDSVARHELAARVEETTRALLQVLAPLLEPGVAVWWAGELAEVPPNQRAMQALLSRLAGSTYSRSPKLHNEIINRRELSSAGVVAAKTVLRRLLAESFQEGLGLTGHGPELSITKALLETPGILRQEPNSEFWVVGPPTDEEWLGVWRAGDALLAEGLTREVAISELWDVWSEAPYGIRAGVLPLLTWALLTAGREHLCLFERGTYLHAWSEELYDRMARWPDDFVVRRLPSDGAGATVVAGLLGALPLRQPAQSVGQGKVPLNEFLSALFEWYGKLPPYSKRTLTVSDRTRRLRAVLTRAKDPVALVLRDIPNSLGFGELGGPRLDEVVTAFAGSAAELDEAYGGLLVRIVEQQASGLGLGAHATATEVRAQFRQLQAGLAGYALRPKTAAFLLRASDTSLPDERWCESVAGAVVGVAPRAWSDSDVQVFDSNIGPLLLELQDGFDTRVRLADSNESLDLASRIALFKHGRPVADVVARRPLSVHGERILDRLRIELEIAILDLPPAEHPSLAARLIELLLPPTREVEGTE